MKIAAHNVEVSGERFSVVYKLTGSEAEARQKAEDITIEQTIEFPADLVPDDDIRKHIFGKIDSFDKIGIDTYKAVISFAIEISSFELTQLLNVIFGNISLKTGIRVESLMLPKSLLKAFKGPRFGIDGWRDQINTPSRPLLCTVVKPMGLPNIDLAELVYQFALGGIDLIKDDHGLTNQGFSPFKERVELCVGAVEKANRQTGYNCKYISNITAPIDKIVDRALYAKEVGAGGLMVAPGIIGLDTMRMIADDDRINLPILSHPSFQGSYNTSPENGISHAVLFGQLARLAGSDGSIYPNWGGRFNFSKEECVSIVHELNKQMGDIKSTFPAPGGGMTMDRIPELIDVYGRDVIFIMGGGIHSHGPDLFENCRFFRKLVESI